jgi:hypothetical protein
MDNWLANIVSDVDSLHVKIDNLNDSLVRFCFIKSIDWITLNCWKRFELSPSPLQIGPSTIFREPLCLSHSRCLLGPPPPPPPRAHQVPTFHACSADPLPPALCWTLPQPHGRSGAGALDNRPAPRHSPGADLKTAARLVFPGLRMFLRTRAGGDWLAQGLISFLFFKDTS